MFYVNAHVLFMAQGQWVRGGAASLQVHLLSLNMFNRLLSTSKKTSFFIYVGFIKVKGFSIATHLYTLP